MNQKEIDNSIENIKNINNQEDNVITYDENSMPIYPEEEITYDENGMPIYPEEEITYDENGMPIYQEDEEEEIEMRRIINEKLLNKNFDDLNFDEIIDSKNYKNKKIKEKKNLNLNEFNIYVDKQIENNKPKKFISRRTIDKKTTNNIEKFKKRNFNSRLPPYFLSDEYKNKIKKVDLNLSIDFFPLLS
jgi:hypothetical protein